MLLPLAGIVGACLNDSTSMPTAMELPSANFGKNVSGSNQKILFESHRDDLNSEVYSINPDGTGATRLTNDPATDQDAVWSPDGKQIAFTSKRDDPLGEIYVMNADGSGVVRLTNSSGSSAWTKNWSKDGKQIVFQSTRGAVDPAFNKFDDVDLYVMNADGSNVIRLTNDNTNDGSAVFSPDGRSIAFTSVRDHPGTNDAELYLMNVDGTNVTRLTFQHGRVDHPSWDAHSRRIAFSIVGSAEDGIYTLNLDDLGLTRLTFDATDSFPSWSADGSQLAFTSRRDLGDSEIYVMNADGTNPTRLTVRPGEDAFPRWSR